MAFGTALLAIIVGVASATFGTHDSVLSDTLLRQMVDRVGSQLADSPFDYPEYSQTLSRTPDGDGISQRAILDPLDYGDISMAPSHRDVEHLAHSSLLGTVLGQYAESNGFRFKPSLTGPKTNKPKSDGVLPAYCNPPNPCPIGYTAEDGCLEEFQNTAAFSRDYEMMQECMCDSEHMFQCPDSTRETEISALARSIQNEGILSSALDKIMQDLDRHSQRIVSKKMHANKVNPYLKGPRLPIAAKKGGLV